MSKKKIFISSVIISLFLLLGICGYAYFIKTIDNTHNISSTLTDNSVVVVKNATEFYEAVQYYDETANDEYNSNEVISSKRKTIQLADNIKLYNNVLVTADYHINLNGYTIDLNGYNLVFKSQFEGTFTVYSNPLTATDDKGTIISTGAIVDSSEGTKTTVDGVETIVKGKIIVDTPNACVTFDKTIVSDTAIVVENASAEQVINSAMKLVYSNIQNVNVNDFYTTIDEVEELGTSHCFIESHTNSSCVYTHSDLDLIYNYFAYKGLTIDYESATPNVLTHDGKIVGNIDATTTVPLTISITYKEKTIKKTVDVHIVHSSDYGNAAISTLVQSLAKYYNNTASKYVVNRAILLPKYNSYFGTKYTYTAVFPLITDTTKYPVYDPESSTFNDYFDGTQYDDYVITTLTSEVGGLIIQSGNASQEIGVQGTASAAINDNYAYASKVAMELFGNQISIYDEENYEGYTMYELLINPLLEGYGYTRLTEISYSVQCNEGTYMIKADNKDANGDGNYDFDLLKVEDDATTKPYLGQDATLVVSFHFNSDGPDEDKINDVIDIPISIVYKVSDAGAGFASFDPYYVYFNKQFENKTNYYTYSSFEIPLSLDGGFPSYGFIVYEKGLDENGNVAYNKVADSETQTQERTLMKITANTNGYTSFDGTTQMSIAIDPYYIKDKDTEYYFLYVPVWKDEESKIYYYYDSINKALVGNLSSISFTTETIEEYEYLSVLTIPGIVRYDDTQSVQTEGEAFADKQMYQLAYELINGYGTYADGKFIISSTLNTNIDIVDFSSTSTLLSQYQFQIALGTIANNDKIIGSLKGINLLTGINELTFNGTNLGANNNFVTNLGYVSEITNLTKLNLSNTGIYDQTSSGYGFPNGDDNGFLSTLTALTNLEYLYLANAVDKEGNIISGLPINQIYDFSALTDFSSLKEVDITGNIFDSGDGLINNILDLIVNLIYGSNGALNAAVFATLTANNVNVIGAGEATNDPNINDLVVALRGLEYQDKVPTGIDLSTVLKQFTDRYTARGGDDFGIPEEFSIDCGDNNDITFTLTSIAFEPNTAGDGFTMVVSYDYDARTLGIIPIESGSVQFTYKYKVTRY